MNFTEDQLRRKYHSKTKRAAEKALPFKITFEQYAAMFLHSDGRCDYTGMIMSDKESADNYVSLERLDSTKGYLPDNVCLVRTDVNSIKGLTMDLAEKRTQSKTPVDNIMLHKMSQTVYNPQKIKEIKEKYQKLFDNLNKPKDTTPQVDTHSQEDVMSEKDNVVTYANEELYFTKAYHDFGVEIESFGVAFQLNYSDFKRLVNRKRCQLTERVVEPRSVRLFVLDKTQPVCKTNVMAVDTSVQQALDTFVVRGGLSLSEIRKLCKNLVK